jgi:hypothetical protein
MKEMSADVVALLPDALRAGSVADTNYAGGATDTFSHDSDRRLTIHAQETESSVVTGSFTHAYTWSCD